MFVKTSNKRVIKGIAAAWADTIEEAKLLRPALEDVYHQKGSYDWCRSYCVMVELAKLKEAGQIEDVDRINSMLTSKDREMSQLGMEMVYNLRETRIKQKDGEA